MTTKSNLIAISGRQNSGKDTVGSIAQFLLHTGGVWDQEYWDDIQKHHPKGIGFNWTNYWEIKKFAGKLKQIATLLTGIPVEKFEDQEFKKTYMSDDWCYTKQVYECDENNQDGFMDIPLTYREFLQKLGTEAIRDGLHPDTWVNALFTDYKAENSWLNVQLSEKPELLYPNWIITDMRFPNEYDAVQKRNGLCVQVIRGGDMSTNNAHSSEIGLDSYRFDYTINNNGSIEELREQVLEMLKHFKLL
jgi:hypothetical protein